MKLTATQAIIIKTALDTPRITPVQLFEQLRSNPKCNGNRIYLEFWDLWWANQILLAEDDDGSNWYYLSATAWLKAVREEQIHAVSG